MSNFLLHLLGFYYGEQKVIATKYNIVQGLLRSPKGEQHLPFLYWWKSSGNVHCHQEIGRKEISFSYWSQNVCSSSCWFVPIYTAGEVVLGRLKCTGPVVSRRCTRWVVTIPLGTSPCCSNKAYPYSWVTAVTICCPRDTICFKCSFVSCCCCCCFF